MILGRVIRRLALRLLLGLDYMRWGGLTGEDQEEQESEVLRRVDILVAAGQLTLL